jgi:hypothetical protein
MKPFALPWHAHAEDGVIPGLRAWHSYAEDGVPGLRSANSYSLRPGTPPSAEAVAFVAEHVHEFRASSAAMPAAGSGATRAVNKNWLNEAGGPALGRVRAKNSSTLHLSRVPQRTGEQPR